MDSIPSLEQLAHEQIKVFQNEKLIEMLRYLSEFSPFYQRHFLQHQIDVNRITSVDGLAAIPPTTKDDLQNYNWDFLCVPRTKVMDHATTSGTMGKPVVIALTEKDVQRLAFNEFLSLRCADGRSEDLYQLMLTLDRQFMAGIAYYEGIKKLGAGMVRVGSGLPALQLETILTSKPTTLIAVPSFLMKLIDYSFEKKIDLNKSSVEKIVCIGENIRMTDFQLNTLGRKITEHWNVKLYSTYASTEMQTAFTECAFGVGGHHHPELIIIEVLDEMNNPVPLGESGDLTITTLGIEGMPLLRFKTGDIVTLHHTACECGRTTLRVSPVMGRRQQMIKLKGTTIYPSGIFDLLHQSGILDYVVEVFSDAFGVDALKLFVSSDDSIQEKMQQDLVENFRSQLRVTPEIVFVSKKEIETMQFNEGKRKPQKFIDRR